MRFYIIIASVIAALVLGKIYLFKKPEEKGGGKPSETKTSPSEKGAKDPKSKPPMPPIPVDVLVCSAQAFENQLSASGTLVPMEEMEIRSETSGRVTSLKIQEGGFVKKGQLIAKIKDDDLKAQQKKIEYEILLAKKQEERQKKLVDINAISKDEYDLTATKISTLSADLELNKVSQEKTLVYAPFSGKISFKNISEGAYITPATVIANLVQINPIKIDFNVPEKYASQMHIGKAVSFEAEEGRQQGISKIAAIDPKIDPNLRTLRVRSIASNQSGKLMPGMFVKIEVKMATNNSIMIPSQAIIPILKGKKVFVVKNGMPEERMIETGTRTDQYVEVIKGLAAGDSLIISGLMAVKPDSKLKIKSK